VCREGAWAELTAEVTSMVTLRRKIAWIFLFLTLFIKNLKKYSKIPQKMLSSSMILLQCYYALQNSDFQGAKRI
jgi:hypothetical protein